MKALALLSGGLDSTLAAKVMQNLGLEVCGVHIAMDFALDRQKVRPQVTQAVSQLGIPLRVLRKEDKFIDIIKKPRHGYGSGANPCIDCRIFELRLAHECMQEEGAGFLVTGEVLGQRPMSQHLKTLKLIEEEAGVKGYVLRPLSAKLLEPTVPEQEGWVDREKLYAINGRSRREQISLAAQMGITVFPQPAGGCFLTHDVFAARVRDLKKYSPGFSVDDMMLLKVGRHFRIHEGLRAVLGRNEEENAMLEQLALPGDSLFFVKTIPGPTLLARGTMRNNDKTLCAAITVRYGKARGQQDVTVIYKHARGEGEEEMQAISMDEEQIQALNLNKEN